MNNLVMFNVAANAFNWTSLASTPTVLSGQLFCDDANVNMRVSGGTPVEMPRGRSITFHRVDLSTIEILGSGATVMVVGGTWP